MRGFSAGLRDGEAERRSSCEQNQGFFAVEDRQNRGLLGRILGVYRGMRGRHSISRFILPAPTAL